MNEQPQTNMRVIMIVVITLALNATIGLSTLAYCLVMKVEPNQVLLTAYLSIVTGLLGLIGGMLTKTAPTETTRQPLPMPTPTSDNPLPVRPVTSVQDPVHTEEAKEILPTTVKTDSLGSERETTP